MSPTLYHPGPLSELPRPYYPGPVAAGFPSPAEDYLEEVLDLNKHLVTRPAATFYIRVVGDSMTGAGILSGDLAVVDRSLEPREGHVVLAVVDGGFTVKRLKRADGELALAAENPAHSNIVIPESGFEVWGVVVHVIHSLAK